MAPGDTGVSKKNQIKQVIMSNIEIKGYVPGSLGRVIELQAIYYDQMFGAGPFFEVDTLKKMSDFFVRFDEKRDGFWTVCLNNTVEGSITIDGIEQNSNIAKLRWLILSPQLRGKGFGKKLVQTAVEFCKDQQYKQIFLWTANKLNEACGLYKSVGFEMVERQTNEPNSGNQDFAFEKFILDL